MSDYDDDSVTNNLRDSANGTFVTLDDFSPLTGTIVGPVIEVQIVKILDQCGLEIAIPSPNDTQRTTYGVISRGKSRFVDEVHSCTFSILTPILAHGSSIAHAPGSSQARSKDQSL